MSVVLELYDEMTCLVISRDNHSCYVKLLFEVVTEIYPADFEKTQNGTFRLTDTCKHNVPDQCHRQETNECTKRKQNSTMIWHKKSQVLVRENLPVKV